MKRAEIRSDSRGKPIRTVGYGATSGYPHYGHHAAASGLQAVLGELAVAWPRGDGARAGHRGELEVGTWLEWGEGHYRIPKRKYAGVIGTGVGARVG